MEDENNIFKNCFKARQIWNKIDQKNLNTSSTLHFNVWIDYNLKSKSTYNQSNLGLSIVFVSTIWNIWKARNKLQFENEVQFPGQIAINCKLLAEETQKAFNANDGQGLSNGPRLIKWSFPNAGTRKINIDASVDQFDRGSFGGLVRSEQGKWIQSRTMGHPSCLKTLQGKKLGRSFN